jgi:hypothetical protein
MHGDLDLKKSHFDPRNWVPDEASNKQDPFSLLSTNLVRQQ